LRNLIPAELAKGFGFIHGKPSGSFSPVAVSPDELDEHWHECKVHLALKTWLNGELFGQPNAGTDMQFGFDQLIEHACKSRSLSAGTLTTMRALAHPAWLKNALLKLPEPAAHKRLI